MDYNISYLESVAPIDPTLVLRIASELAAKEHYDDATKLYLKLTDIEPCRVHAWMNLANIYLVHAEFDKAMEAAQNCLKLGGKRECYLQQALAKIYIGYDDLVSAEKHAIIAETMEPENQDIINFHLELLGFKNQFTEFYTKAPTYIKSKLYLSNLPWCGEAASKFKLEFILGKFDDFIEEPVFSFNYSPLRSAQYEFRPYTGKNWEGDSLDNRSILIYTEQGLGDNIWLLGHVKKLKEKYPTCKITVAAYNTLHPVISKCPFIDEILYPVFDLKKVVETDYICSIFKLLQFLPLEDHGPYMPIFTHKKLPETNKKKIIVNWLCNETNKKIAYRKMLDLNLLSTLLHKYKDTSEYFVCQNPEHEKRITDDIEKYNLPITPLFCPSLDDLFSYIYDSDLVVTNDTLHIHVAGSLGKEGIVILTKNLTLPFWGRATETIPYYNSIRLIRGVEKTCDIQL
jgi:tetratricopeptide (TPR) repeat protein